MAEGIEHNIDALLANFRAIDLEGVNPDIELENARLQCKNKLRPVYDDDMRTSRAIIAARADQTANAVNRNAALLTFERFQAYAQSKRDLEIAEIAMVAAQNKVQQTLNEYSGAPLNSANKQEKFIAWEAATEVFRNANLQFRTKTQLVIETKLAFNASLEN